MSSDSFWAKTNEDEFESLELFQELEQSFGTGRARNLELDSKPKLKLPKIKELKVLDAKSAQNICKIIIMLFNCTSQLIISIIITCTISCTINSSIGFNCIQYYY